MTGVQTCALPIYPMMFRNGNIAVINKIDLAGFVGCNIARMEEDIHKYNPIMPIFKTNLKTGEGVEELVKEILR